MRLIVLAAGQGTRLRPLTDDRPKCLVGLAGQPLLDRQIAAARSVGIDDIVVVGGYRIDRLADYPVRLMANPHYAETNMVRTLFCARAFFGDGFIMSYGDICYAPSVLSRTMASDAPIAVAIDRAWRSYWGQRFADPLSDAETLVIDGAGRIREIGQKPKRIEDIDGQYIGLVAFRDDGVRALEEAFEAAEREEASGRFPFGGTRRLDQLYMTDLLQGLITRDVRLTAVPIDGGWVEIDSPRDLDIAESLVAKGRLEV